MILDQIKADTIAAMKTADPLRVSVLRMLASEANYKKIDVQRELNDEDMQAVLSREAKKRREAIEAYSAAGRTESAEKEALELKILEAYMPKLMLEEEVKAEISKLELPADFGQAMRIVSPLFKGRAEGGMVAKIVKELCSK